MNINYEIRYFNNSLLYIALLVRFFAGLLSPGALRSSSVSDFAPNTGAAGALPNTMFLPPRLAGLVRPGGALEAALSAGFDGALSLVWKSSLVMGFLVGGAPLVDFFLGGDAIREVAS